MTAEEAKSIAKSVSQPAITALNTYLKIVLETAKKGKFECWFNTAEPNMDALHFAKEKGYRVFIRKGNDHYGYPLYCIYWGEEKNPVPNFGISSLDIPLIYEL